MHPSVSDWKITLHFIRDRLKLWSQCKFAELWNAVTTESAKLTSTLSGSSDIANILRAKKALEDGQYRKDILSLSSKGLAPVDNDSLQALLSLHPQTPPHLCTTPYSSPSLYLIFYCPWCYLLLSKRFIPWSIRPKVSSPGPSGLHPTHLKAVHCPSSPRASRVLSALISFCQLASSGQVPLR